MSAGRQEQASRAQVLALGAFACLMRLPSLLTPYAINDESVYAVVATELAHGGVPYLSAIERKPPLLFWIYEAVLRLFGSHALVGVHLCAALFILLTLWAVYCTARSLWNPQSGLCAAFVYALFSAGFIPSNLACNGEILMNMPLAWGAYTVFTRKRSAFTLALGGAACALAFLIKQPAAIAALAFGVYLLLPMRSAQGVRGAGRAFMEAAAFSVGFVAVLALVALHLQSLGALREAYYWTIGDHDVPHGIFDRVFWIRGAMLFAWCGACLPLTLTSAYSVLKPQRFWSGLRPEYFGMVLLLICSMIGTAASGRFYPHYFLQLLLPQALLAGPVLASAWREELHESFWLRRRTIVALLGLAACAFLSVNAVMLWPRAPHDDVIDYVRAHSTPSDKIFIWGQASHMYLEAERRPASRYINTFPLTGYIFGSPESHDPNFDTSSRILPGAWQILASDLARTPPRLIVDTDSVQSDHKYPPSKYPVLQALLARSYERVFQGRHGIVYRRR